MDHSSAILRLHAARFGRRLLLQRSAAGALAASGVLARSSTRAHEATPSPIAAEPPLPAGCVQVAGNLVNPRYLTIAPDGSLYVSEAGTGGDELLYMPSPEAATPEMGTPQPAQPVGNRGFTGRVSKIAPDGTVMEIATGFPSYNVEEPVGPAGIAFANEKLWLAIGGAGPGTAFLDPLPNENTVVVIDPVAGTVTPIADIGAYERANNPHPAAVDSNLYGLAVGADGTLYVADAGGNTIYAVNPESGDLKVVAVLNDIPSPPGTQGPPMLEPVPTGVAINPSGGLFVGLLSGGPFPPGAAKVLAIAPDGTVSDAATGLTMVVDVAVGPDGNLYASQISLNFLSQPPALGNVVRIAADGSHEVVVDGVPFPNGIAFDADGNLYVVANTVSFGPPAGMILRCDGIATPQD